MPVLFVLRMLALVAVLTASIAGGLIGAGERSLSLSTEALERADGPDAVLHAKRAALWYVPFAPHVDRGYERLRAIGEAASSRGEIRLDRTQ